MRKIIESLMLCLTCRSCSAGDDRLYCKSGKSMESSLTDSTVCGGYEVIEK